MGQLKVILGALGLFNFLCVAFIVHLAFKTSPPIEVDPCQKRFNTNTKNTTLYKQKNIPHKGIKPARVVIECEVRK